MAGRRVLVTRAAGDSAELRTRLENLGAEVIELPLIAIEPLDDTARLDQAVANLKDYDWVAFTSRHAVQAVSERLASLDVPFPSVPPRVAAVGEATDRALTGHGIAVHAIPTSATAHALADLLSSLGIRGSRVLLPRGNLARADLERELRSAGAHVETVIAYRTVPVAVQQPPVAWSDIDVVTIASPSAARNLRAILPNDAYYIRFPRCACIGPVTAQAARSLGLEVSSIAKTPSVEGLLAAIQQALTVAT